MAASQEVSDGNRKRKKHDGTAAPSNRRKRPSAMREATVKMCLKKHLQMHSVLPVIDAVVDNVSRRCHRASLLLNHYVIHCLEQGDDPSIDVSDQMLYFTALTVDGIGQKYPALRAFWSARRKLYEDIPRIEGTTRPINSAARGMKTVFCNYLWMTFNQRIKTLFRSADQEDQEERPPPLDTRALKSLIWRVRNMPRYVSSLAFQARNAPVAHEVLAAASFLGEAEITDKWLVTNASRTLRFLYTLLAMTVHRGAKAFTILPVMSIRRHHISIDGGALRDLLVSAGELPSSVTQTDFLALRDDYFRAVFRVRDTWHLGNEVKTDGVSLCVNVWRRVSEPLGEARLIEMYGDCEEYHATDPGEKNLAAVVHAVSGQQVSRCRLTSKQLAVESHAARNLAVRKRYDEAIKDVMNVMANETLKTHRADAIQRYLEKKARHYPRLWEHHAALKTSAWRMDTYIHRWSCVDRFWHKATCGNRYRPLMKYGAASVSSTGIRGRRAGPSKLVRKACAKHFSVVDVDEYMTTKRCCDCHETTVAVGQRFVGPLNRNQRTRWWNETRGLRRCRSNECRGSPLKSRDYAASWNIGIVWPERPLAFRRG